MASVKEDPKSPWPHYFSIGAGVCIAALAFFKEHLSSVDIIKLMVGVGLIGYGIWKLVARPAQGVPSTSAAVCSCT